MIHTPNLSIFLISVLWAQISRNSFIFGPQRASAGPKSNKNVRPAAAGSNPSISFIFRALGQISRNSIIFGPPRASAGPKSKKKKRPATSSRLKSKHFLQIPGSGPNIKEFLHFPASAGSISRNSYIFELCGPNVKVFHQFRASDELCGPNIMIKWLKCGALFLTPMSVTALGNCSSQPPHRLTIGIPVIVIGDIKREECDSDKCYFLEV